jgi:membrane-associated protease RseP (regulator of RpoE activity)
VQTVQPGSPAARAGLEPGDTIVAVNRTDGRVRSLEPYLREPGAKLNLTVAREGGRRDIAVTVGQRPLTFDGACLPYRDFRFLDASGRDIVMFRTPGTPTPAGSGSSAVRSGSSASGQGGAVRTRVSVNAQGQSVPIVLSPDSMAHSTFIMVPPAGAAGALFLSRGGSGAIVAGAEVSLVNGGLKAIFAVDYGALVLNVAPRSPAEQAGIVSGDVIVRANGENVTAIAVLQRAIQASREKRSVALDVIRAKQAKQITLRW